jgi:hypothetical protein
MAGRGEEQRERGQLARAPKREKTVKIAVVERFFAEFALLLGSDRRTRVVRRSRGPMRSGCAGGRVEDREDVGRGA